MEKYFMIKNAFEEQSDKASAAAMSAYMRELFLFYGLKAQRRKAVYNELLQDEKKQKRIDWELLDICYEDEHREFQYFVCDYLAALSKYVCFEDIRRIKQYIDTKQWWDTIDSMHKIIGDIGLKDERVRELMLQWSIDDNFWVRRIAIDHQLGRKEKTDYKLLERIILNNLGSNEFFINKAIGWSLRDYSKTNAEWVRGFIYENRDRMSKLSIREASKYI